MKKTLLLKSVNQVGQDQEHLAGGQKVEDLLNAFKRQCDMVTIAGDTEGKVLTDNIQIVYNTLSRIIFIQGFYMEDVDTLRFKDDYEIEVDKLVTFEAKDFGEFVRVQLNYVNGTTVIVDLE